MTVQCLIVAVFALLMTYGTVVGQTLQRPQTQAIPMRPPIDAEILDRLGRTKLTELAGAQQVRNSTSSNPNLPNQGELVSILKRRLPKQNQTIEVKDAPEWFQTMMQRIVRENVPQKYVQDKDWGKTERRWDGVKVQRKGVMQWYTKRKWKDVNHGSWKRYEVTQIDPNENLKMRIENVQDAGGGKVAFEVALAAKMHVFGRMANWAKGIQMYNISADADASVEMRVWCLVGMQLDVRRFPPDVIMMPQVTQADLRITDFRLQRVSKLQGPMVKQLSSSVHKVLHDKIQEKRHGLPDKINREIAKNRDDMRLSLADFASSKWNALTNGGESNSKTAETEKTKVRSSQTVSAPPATLTQTKVNSGRTISEMREGSRLKANLPRRNPTVANRVVQNQSAMMRSILVQPKMRVSTITRPIATQSVIPELVPPTEPVATRIQNDVGPAVELLELVPRSELAKER